MKIIIAASHRFHLLDLAKTLALQGHDVKFYSYLSAKRQQKFGLEKKNTKSLLVIMSPLLFLVKFSKRAHWAIRMQNLVLDYYMSFFIPRCDVYIALGTVYYKSFKAAKSKYNALTILEWGSKHIIEENKKITENSDKHSFKKWIIDRSIKGYNCVDKISIASEHVLESFLLHGYKLENFIINPYGVDLHSFHSTVLKKDPFDIIFVGGWSYRKGCDIIVNVLKDGPYTFLHVGSIVDLTFPALSNFTHVDSVNQLNLINYYSKARIFILLSRTEGLAMVQAQAIACGLPVVCTKNTGGRDLRNLLTDKKWIIETKDNTKEEIINCINDALKIAKTQQGERNYAHDDIENMSWEAYGKRYSDILNNLKEFRNNIDV
ncbi:MAG: glycosyltransferase family 4 protein [Arachidicoccus sp.]|nr:glycosyltransferase family 4 protein [Arachidicoccus sp.]